MVDPRIMKIHKNPPGIYLTFSIPTFYSLIEKLNSQISFCMVATLIVHRRIMKIHRNLLEDKPNNFPYQNIIVTLRNCIHK